MAFCVRKENVFLYCVSKSHQILLIKAINSPECATKSYILECPPSKTISNSSKLNQPMKEHSVIVAAVSNCGKFIAACDSNNFLHLWKSEEETWKHEPERQLMRKGQKIIFTNSGLEIIVADRSGDVFVYSVVEPQKEGKFLLGHISLITDIAISSDDNYILTCDRDSKIRISCYPNGYNIHSYCLGHEEFVSSVQSIQLSKEFVLSSSGDGSIRLWDFNGDMLCQVNLFENEILCKNVESSENLENSKATFSCLLDDRQSTFAVKSVKYSRKQKVLAISFYAVKGIAIYGVTDIKKDFTFIQFIPIESIPFDIFFDAIGNLAILQKNSKQYTYLKYIEENSGYFKEVDNDAIPLLKEIEKFSEHIDNLHEFQDGCEFLFKRNFDDKEDFVETKNTSKKSKVA